MHAIFNSAQPILHFSRLTTFILSTHPFSMADTTQLDNQETTDVRDSSVSLLH